MAAVRWSTRRCLWIFSLALPGLIGGCTPFLKNISRPSARIRDVQLQDIGLHELTVTLVVEVTNPASMPLPLLDTDYELSSNGTSFLSGSAPLQGSVPAQGARSIDVPLRVTYAGISQVLTGMRPGSVVPITARLTLGVNAPVLGRIELPLRREAELPVPAVPDVQLTRIEWSELSLQQASATAHLNVTNPNAFAVELRALDYALRLGATPVVSTRVAPGAELIAGSTRDVPIPVGFSPAALATGAYRVLTGSSARYTLRGTLELGTRYGSMVLPLDASGDVPFTH